MGQGKCKVSIIKHTRKSDLLDITKFPLQAPLGGCVPSVSVAALSNFTRRVLVSRRQEGIALLINCRSGSTEQI